MMSRITFVGTGATIRGMKRAADGPQVARPADIRRVAGRALRRFGRAEAGAITPLMLTLFLGLVLVSGVSLDLVRHEKARASLQHALDRGVLAAAQSPGYPLPIVESYLAGRPVADGGDRPALTVEATDTRDGRYRVSAAATAESETIFLRLLGVDRLAVRAEAAASEVRAAFEIALALDVSASMGAGTGLGPLRAAVAEFSRDMLRPGGGDRATISLVPFAGSVNPGPRLFSALGGVPRHEVSSCLALETGDFATLGLPSAGRYAQVPAFLDWPRAGFRRTGDDGHGWCPGDPEYDWIDPLSGRALGFLVGLSRGGERVLVEGSTIAAHASDPATIERRLAALRTHHGTSPQEGLKWALGLLMPSARAVLEREGIILGDRPGRPLPLDRPDGRKVVVLVTDGRISEAMRPDWETDERRSLLDGPRLLDRLPVRGARSHLLDQCRLAAEATVPIYVIAVALQERTLATYRQCLGDQAEQRLLITDRAGLSGAFRYIRRRLADLRLER